MKYLLIIVFFIVATVGYPTNYNFFNTNLKTIKNGLINKNFRWSKGVVPYIIDDGFSQEELTNIQKPFDEFHKNTCITFKPKNKDDVDYIKIINNVVGCHSEIGRQGGEQILRLRNPLCVRKPGLVMHELMHTIGFYHEQSRPDRDDYVTILWENILDNKKTNFEKYGPEVVSTFGESYDYDSIMHYSQNGFSKNGKSTIVPKDTNIGQRIKLSKKDISKINKMYQDICTSMSN